MIYDRFQKEAIDYIDGGHSVVVSAPTGAGKTAIAEYVIEEALRKNTAVIYTAPIKALSNQKFRDFQALYSDSIGILTGDVSLNQDAPILIMTTEIFRNKIMDEPSSLERYSWVIFDEVHYIDNPERGTVWEESLMFLPRHINILCLSATIPNIGEFARWISSIHKKDMKVVIENNRPVPLHFLFQYDNKMYDNLNKMRISRSHHPNKITSLVKYILERDGLPCIYFVFGRKRAEYLAEELYNFNFLNAAEREEIMTLFNSLCERFDLKNEKSAVSMIPLIERGIAFHHAGMLPTLKEVIERLFTSRLIKVIFTTETFALGINMPSRSVVFDDMQKFYGRFTRPLKTRDFYQMAGRAGRRGIDIEGFVYSRINPHRVRLEDVRRIIYGRPEDVRSQFNTSYATLLNLFELYKDKLFDVYPSSLHYFQTRHHQQKQALGIMESKLRILRDMRYIYQNELTDKGKFAKAVYGYELLLAELYEDGVFERLDEIGLAVIAVSVVFEPRKNEHLRALNKRAEELKIICDRVYDRIRHKEAGRSIYPLSKCPHFHLAKTIEAWMQGATFSKILQLADSDEGEVIRYFRMAVQIMREIRKSPISPSLKDKITNAARIINRDVIDAEKQLREG